MAEVDVTGWRGLRGVPEHGTRGRYARGCRCEICRAPVREYAKTYRAKHRHPRKIRSDKNVRKVPEAHGTHTEYTRGCRCRECKDAHAAERRNVTGYKRVTLERKLAAPARARANLRNYRARKAGNGGTHTATDIQAQYDRQKGECFYCGMKVGKKYHVDHVIPLVLGGFNGPENLVVACPTCNCSKGFKHPQDFCGKLL